MILEQYSKKSLVVYATQEGDDLQAPQWKSFFRQHGGIYNRHLKREKGSPARVPGWLFPLKAFKALSCVVPFHMEEVHDLNGIKTGYKVATVTF